MSSSVAERLDKALKDLMAANWRPGLWALAGVASAIPLGILGYATGSGPLVSVSGVALVFSALAGGMGAAAAVKRNRASAESQADAFDHLVEHVRDAVLQFNARGDLVRASRSSRKLFGCESYELSGDGLTERTHVLDRPLLMTALAEARKDGKDRLFEARMRRDSEASGRKAPDYVWIEIGLSPVRHANSASGPYEVFALLRDISRRKSDERRMRDAQKAAEEASEAKSRFLATIGHELRTPLNAIVGFSDMMTSGIGGELSATQAEYAGLISQSGHHLLEVVNMLLDMSKIEAGRFELMVERFEPESLVAPCLRIISAVARERNVEIEVNLGKNLPEVMGDERACRQILINLLSNAVKFSNPGDCVTWSMKRQGQTLAITVADTGIGMDREVLSRLGEPFFQAEDSPTRRFEGTGLGMSIVKGLVELHDGTLKINSEPGRGTTVSVLLPINGPETKIGDNGGVTRLRPEKDDAQPSKWPEEPRRLAR